jgi:hypothetical protein
MLMLEIDARALNSKSGQSSDDPKFDSAPVKLRHKHMFNYNVAGNTVNLFEQRLVQRPVIERRGELAQRDRRRDELAVDRRSGRTAHVS